MARGPTPGRTGGRPVRAFLHLRGWAFVTALAGVLVLAAPAAALAQDLPELPDDLPPPEALLLPVPSLTPPDPAEGVPPLPPQSTEADPVQRTVRTGGEGDEAAGESAESSTASGGTAEEIFDLRMRTVAEQVGDLKEKVSRTKARLQILADTVLGGAGVSSGAKLVLEHHNQLGSSYRLVGVQYSLDGAPAFIQMDESGDLDEVERIPVFDQRVVPGEHQLVVRYTLRGRGYGVFSYLDKYTLELTATHDFTVEPGKVTSVRALLREKAGLTLRFEDRPDVAFETHVETDLHRRELASPQASTGGAGP